MNVADRIKYFRQKNGITVNKLANMAGISQSYLRDIELGKKQPTIEYLSYICGALKISLVTFFSEDEATDEVNTLIDRLTDEQKRSLTCFLKTIL